MELNIKQKNNLLTGVKLAVELEASETGLKRFITVFGYLYNEEHKFQELTNVIKTGLDEEVYFEIRCYEIPVEYYDNHWDVTDDILINDELIDDIKGIKALENELKNYIDDFSILKPEWYCDNLL